MDDDFRSAAGACLQWAAWLQQKEAEAGEAVTAVPEILLLRILSGSCVCAVVHRGCIDKIRKLVADAEENFQ